MTRPKTTKPTKTKAKGKNTPKPKSKNIGKRKRNTNRPGSDTPDRPLTTSEERFCVEYAATGNGTAAYRAANPDSTGNANTMAAQASRLLALHKIKSRIAELQAVQSQVVTETFAADAKWIAGRFVAHAEANIGDYLEWGFDEIPRVHKETGEPIRDSKGRAVVARVPWMKAKASADLTREQMALIAGVELIQGQGGPPTLRLKLHDKHDALKEIGKLGGHYRETIKVEHDWIDDAATSLRKKVEAIAAAAASEPHEADTGSTQGDPDQPDNA